MVVADPERLMQVMANLLSNAAKFTRPGSMVTVEASASGRHVQLSVRDQGNGIPAAIQGRVFEKFTQGESANTRGREGSGLGLSIARQMVDCMNGDIRFETEAGVGTTFFVTLPTAEFGAGDHDAPGRKAAA
jgi:signal transduction histidine kinase